MQYLLDTNACVAYLRRRNVQLRQRFHARPTADLFLCSVVKAELRGGTLRSYQPKAERAKLNAFMQPYVSLPFDDGAAEEFARIRFHLESLATPIGPYDMQIASIALTNRLTLVTHNVGEFSRVPGLAIEDWEVS